MHELPAHRASALTSANEADLRARATEAGKVRPGVLLWALGLPIPIVLLFLLIRGCA